MTEKEKRIVEKLKAIINNTPYEGEKATALNVLRNYCKKHNLDLNTILSKEPSGGDVKDHIYEFTNSSKYRRKLVFQTVANYMQRKGFDHKGLSYTQFGKRIRVYIPKVTSEDYLIIVTLCELYWKGFKNQIDDFYIAFLTKNQLFIEPDSIEQPTLEELERYERASLMARGMDEVRDPYRYKRVSKRKSEVKLLQ